MSEEIQAILDKGTCFKGNLSFEGVVRIAGSFEGDITSSGSLIIEETGRVKGKIEVHSLILHGFLEGDVKALKQVCMIPPARFIGKVESPSLKIEEGVIFEGSSLHAKKSS